MDKYDIDLSSRRFNPIWLLVGAIIGRAVGLIIGLNMGMWYFTDSIGLALWQILGVFVLALFVTFLMTSDSPVQTKGAILGLGIGFAFALYTGEIWIMLQHRQIPGFDGMSFSEGIFFEWLFMHASWLGLAIGWMIGAKIAKGRKKGIAMQPVTDKS